MYFTYYDTLSEGQIERMELERDWEDFQRMREEMREEMDEEDMIYNEIIIPDYFADLDAEEELTK